MASEFHNFPLFKGLKKKSKKKKKYKARAICLDMVPLLWCEHRVQQTSVFWLLGSELCLQTYPLLSIAVFNIIDPSVIPLKSNSYKPRRPEPVLCHNYKIGEETSKGLDHTWTDKKWNKTDEPTAQCNCNRKQFVGDLNHFLKFSLKWQS